MAFECPVDSKHAVTLVEYAFDNAEYYDGISEIKCLSCKKRYGRWSKRELKSGEYAPVYGGNSAEK